MVDAKKEVARSVLDGDGFLSSTWTPARAR
jgi:hypothetical protein